MIIVLEGADNSGKSTLAKYLAAATGFPVVDGKGPPKSLEEINSRVEEHLKFDHVIFDRHACVSNTIYDAYRETSIPVDPLLIAEFYDSNPLFIYCTSDGSLSSHILNEKDTPEHVQLLVDHNHKIVADYDEWAKEHANWVYRKGRTDMANIAFLINAIHRMHEGPFDPVADVRDFHVKFGLPLQRSVVGMLPDDQADFRERFMQEELDEYGEAREELAGLIFEINQGDFFAEDKEREEYTAGLEKQLDALVDLVYVAIGTALFHGFDFKTAWRRVQQANMAKVRAASDGSDSKRNSSFDVVKPEGWLPPSHTDLVANNDFDQVVKNA